MDEGVNTCPGPTMTKGYQQAPSPYMGAMSPEDERLQGKLKADVRREKAGFLADSLRTSAKAMLFEAQRLLETADQTEKNW